MSIRNRTGAALAAAALGGALAVSSTATAASPSVTKAATASPTPTASGTAKAGTTTQTKTTTKTTAKATPAPKKPHPHGNRTTTPAKRAHPHGNKGSTAAKRPHPKRKPWPVTLTVQTVPATPGIVFTFDGQRLVTNASGTASYTREHDLRSHSLTLLTTALDTSQQHLRFDRWAGQRNPDDTYLTKVTGLPMRQAYTVTAAFSVQYPVSARFTDQHGNPIGTSRISGVRLRGDSGQPVQLPTSGSVWLTGLSPKPVKGTLGLAPVSYSLQQLTVDGAQVADAGKQTISPSSSATRARHGAVVLVGQFHDLTVTAHDALFAQATGSTAYITGPDGTTRQVPLAAGHSVTLSGLPRGHYTVSVRAGGGIVVNQEIELSQDHTSDVSVISTEDLGTMGGALVLTAGVLLLGRMRGLRLRLRPLERKEAAA